MNTFESFINSYFGTDNSTLPWYWRLIIVTVIVLASYLVDTIFNRLFVPVIRRITSHTETKVDDILLSHKVCKSFGNILPPVILTFALPFVVKGTLELVLERICNAYIIICITRFLCVFIGAIYEAFVSQSKQKTTALKGLVQTVQIIISLVAAILVVSNLLDKSPAILISGLGAMAAVLMLVFQDSIKGLVAGIQLALNDMLVPGDWICMPGRNVDGVVIEITLTTVKVRNWDNTILTIPPYNLLSESFQNWRGMSEAEGRRLTRAVHIDMHSVRFLTAAEVKHWQEAGILSDQAQVGEVTNLETFRLDFLHYLRQNPDINPDMTLMVRQLSAGTEGIPVQVYAFSRTKEWEAYEEIQSRLIENMLARLSKFGLWAYQRGSDNPVKVGDCYPLSSEL